MTNNRPGIVYESETVKQVLGFQGRKTVPSLDSAPPKAGPDELVIYYGGWSWGQMEQFVRPSSKALPSPDPGYYRLLLPIQGSNLVFDREKNSDAVSRLEQQLKKQYPGAGALPAVIGATALAVYRSLTGRDLLQSRKCFCNEEFHHSEKGEPLFVSAYTPGQSSGGLREWRTPAAIFMDGDRVSVTAKTPTWGDKYTFIGAAQYADDKEALLKMYEAEQAKWQASEIAVRNRIDHELSATKEALKSFLSCIRVKEGFPRS